MTMKMNTKILLAGTIVNIDRKKQKNGKKLFLFPSVAEAYPAFVLETRPFHQEIVHPGEQEIFLQAF